VLHVAAEAAYLKAGFLSTIIEAKPFPLIAKDADIQLLDNTHGGYNFVTLTAALDNPELAKEAIKHRLLMFDAFHDMQKKNLKPVMLAQQMLSLLGPT
jgi:aconitase B